MTALLHPMIMIIIQGLEFFINDDRIRWYGDVLAIFKALNVSSANWNYKSDQFGFVGNDGKSIEAAKSVLIDNLF